MLIWSGEVQPQILAVFHLFSVCKPESLTLVLSEEDPVHGWFLLDSTATSAEQDHIKRKHSWRGRSLWQSHCTMSYRGQRQLKQLAASLGTIHECPCPRGVSLLLPKESCIFTGMWEIRYFIASTPQSSEFWGMQTLYMSRNPLRRCVLHNCRLVFCSPGGRWGIRQGAGLRKGTYCLLTVFKTSRLHSTLQWNLVSETSALLCEMTFLVQSQPEKTVSEVISSASAQEWSGKGKKKIYHYLTAGFDSLWNGLVG